MTFDTYRYLFSALTQVFGAIIAIGGVFIVWKYDIIHRRIEQLTKRLGVLVYFIENHTTGYQERTAYGDGLMRADEFLTYEPNKVIEIVEEKIETIEEEIKNDAEKLEKGELSLSVREERSYSKRRIKLILNKFKHYLMIKDSFPQSIWKIMGIPALLVIALSIGLICTDFIINDTVRLCISLGAIMISAIGLCVIITISSESFKEVRI